MLGSILFILTSLLTSHVHGEGVPGLLACTLENDVYVVTPVGHLVASDWTNSKTTPVEAIYSEDAEYIMMIYEPSQVPAHFISDAETSRYNCLQVRSGMGF